MAATGSKTESAVRRREEADRRVKTSAHPLRRAILQHVRDKGARSPTEVSWELAEELSTVSYHFRKLVEYGRLEKVREEKVRGTIKSWYVAVERDIIDTEEWKELDSPTREGVLIDYMQPMVDDFTHSLRKGILGADGNWIVTRTPIKATDRQGFDEMREAHERLFDEITAIESEGLGRLRESGEDPVAVSSGQTCFEVPGF